MEVKLCEVSEEYSERCRDILRKNLHQAQAVPSMPNYMLQRLLNR